MNKVKKIRIFDIINAIIMSLIVIITLYPMLYMLAISLSSNNAVLTNSVVLFPKEFSTEAYERIVQQTNFWRSYLNTIIYTVGGTGIAMFMTIICAYPLAKKELPFRATMLKLMVFTMYFSGGLIPNYILAIKLGIVDTIWAIVIPGSISVFNVLIMRTFFINIPDSIEEAALIDGMGYINILILIILPLSKSILATITLFNAVYFWNDWFTPSVYLNSDRLMPVTVYLRNLLMGAQIAAQSGSVAVSSSRAVAQTLQAAVVILVVLPIVCVYPFVQKYFVQGVMVGSIKE